MWTPKMGNPKTKDLNAAPTVQDPNMSSQEVLSAPMDQSPASLQQTLDKILNAIAESRDTLQQQIGSVAVELGLLRADHTKLSGRVTTHEAVLKTIQPEHQQIQQQLKGLTERVKLLENRAEDAEGCNRRNNIRVVGMPEKEEGGDMVSSLEKWLQETVAPDGLSPFFALERAHRVPTRPPAPGRPPRPIIARLLHFRDRDTLLNRSRLNGPFQINNTAVSLFPDFTAQVQAKRVSFLEVKKAMRVKGITYSVRSEERRVGKGV